MCDRHVAHLPLDHEGKPRRQEAFEENAVDVTRMIGDDDTAFDRQILQAVYFGTHAGQQERGASRTGDESATALETRYQYSHEK